ncbi:hypothetical protein [Paenibacillus shenyangensis]|uniref:hypothetical protein n=1 Tax=Paenibacillus sp. A9 TaxID=1284352 RepID=UPI000379DBBC|nr:hypothetical protein [Paenibacillus sp. A9]
MKLDAQEIKKFNHLEVQFSPDDFIKKPEPIIAYATGKTIPVRSYFFDEVDDETFFSIGKRDLRAYRKRKTRSSQAGYYNTQIGYSRNR